MKKQNLSSSLWEERVLALLAQHPETVSVTDGRHLATRLRGGADGIWRVRQDGAEHDVAFAIALAAPGTREVRFEVAEIRGADRAPGKAFAEEVQLVFVCSPESHSMLTIPAHELRELITRKAFPRSVTQASGRDVRGVVLSERVLIPLIDLAGLHGATVSTPESW